jgi:Fe-S-cluster-containing hydrogenase component 2
VKECPVDAIALNSDGRAQLDEEECIRCGRCHDVCPQEAVRHDSERVPQEVAANLQWISRLLANFSEPDEQSAFMERIRRFFNKERKVVDQTLDAIAAAGADPGPKLETKVRSLLSGDGSTTPRRSEGGNG